MRPMERVEKDVRTVLDPSLRTRRIKELQRLLVIAVAGMWICGMACTGSIAAWVFAGVAPGVTAILLALFLSQIVVRENIHQQLVQLRIEEEHDRKTDDGGDEDAWDQ